MVAQVSCEESVSFLHRDHSSCSSPRKDDIFCYSQSEFPPLSRKLSSDSNPGNIKQHFKVKPKATRGDDNNDSVFGEREGVTKENRPTIRKQLRSADELWCFNFTEVWEKTKPCQSLDSQKEVKYTDCEDLLFFEFDDTFVCGRKFKHILRHLEKASKRKSVSLLRDKCLPERDIAKLQCKGKKLFTKSDISTRRRCRCTNIDENNLKRKQNIEKRLKIRGATRNHRLCTSVELDLDALNSAMPTTLAQQRRLRMSKVAIKCNTKVEKTRTMKEPTRKQRLKPRWKKMDHNSKKMPPNKFELHETNMRCVDTTDDDILWQLINIQHRELTPEDYELLLRLDEQVAPKTVSKDQLKNMTVVTIDENKMAEIGDGLCSVCMECYSLKQKVKYLPCKHFYHEQCIDNWLLYCDTKCPLDGIEVS